MSAAAPIPLLAFVTPNERAIVEAAARRLADALGQAAGEPRPCAASFVEDAEALEKAPDGAIILTSLLTALEPIDRPWAECEASLRTTFEKLAERGAPVLAATIVRHVPPGGDPDETERRRIRVRRLNLLATELSREYGVFVVDLDRAIADIGARRLDTDYRLGGDAVAEVAGNAVALCIMANALDDFVPFDLQDKARATLADYRPPVGSVAEIRPHELMALGQGRRRQLVATVTDAHQDGHASWLIRQVLTGKIGPREAAGKLVQAIQHRGVKESVTLLFSGVSRLVRRS